MRPLSHPLSGFELVAVAYFAGLASAAAVAAVPARRRLTVSLAALAVAAFVWLISTTANAALRAWAPHAYLIAGYWLPALLTPRVVPPTRFERWLVRADAALRPRLPPVPGVLTHVAEFAYLMCYPLVPALFLVMWIAGTRQDIDRFWIAVLAAGYASYATLPWLISRPPRLALDSAVLPTALGAVNVFVLTRVSHQLNTFPSGHVAIACAAAMMVASVSPLAGALGATAAAAIAVGAAAGGYHYVVDVLLGIVVGIVAGTLALGGP